MPIPKPRKGEKEKDFLARCMSNEAMNKEYPDNKQRMAICGTQWRKKDKKSEKSMDVIKNYEYLLHHIEVNENGDEEIHHCLILDHIANLFEQAHLVIKNGKAYINGKEIKKDGVYHIIKDLEPTQDVTWNDEEAKEHEIKPKKMVAGMKFKKKSKEW